MTVGGSRRFEPFNCDMRDTSEFVAKKLIDRLRLDLDLPNLPILEPSAGEGFLADAINDAFPNAAIHCVELNKERFDVLKTKFPNAIHGDFLKVELPRKYYLIIAAPPFKSNMDLAHIIKMYNSLHIGGVVVSLTSPYWLTNNEPLQVEFREWLKDKKHTLEILPDMSFSERGKTVPTAIIEIWKQ